MNRNRLTISSSLQIYFDQEGIARYQAPGRTIESVEAELAEWQEFVDRWLESVPTPQKSPPEAERLKSTLQQAMKSLKRSKLPSQVIVPTLRVMANHLRNQWNAPAKEEADLIVNELISEL